MTMEEIFKTMQDLIAEQFAIDADEISMDSSFVDDLGADSLDIFQIIMGIEEEFDIEIAQEEAEKIVSVGDAVEAIRNLKKDLMLGNLVYRK